MIRPDPVFNEPSVEPLAANRSTARTRMAHAVQVLAHAPQHGLGSSLRISSEFYLLALSEGYNITDWITDEGVARDDLNLFLSLAAKSPFLSASDGEALYRLTDTEVTCGEITHEAFLAAHCLDTALISFDHGNWTQPDLIANVSYLDGEGELISENRTLVNVATVKHFAHHRSWFADRSAARDATDLWARRTELFPNLAFSPSVESQLTEHQSILSLIVERLKDLQRVARSGSPFSPTAFHTHCSPTSNSTYDKYGMNYNFRTAEGTIERCGWHLYLPDGRRIYFSDTYLIGHVGSHLPTVRYQ